MIHHSELFEGWHHASCPDPSYLPSLPPGSIAEEPPCVSTIYDYFNHKLIWASCQGFWWAPQTLMTGIVSQQQQWRQQQLMRPATSSTMIHTNNCWSSTFFLTGSSIDISHLSLSTFWHAPFSIIFLASIIGGGEHMEDSSIRQPSIYGGEHRLASMVNRSEFGYAAKEY